MSDQFDYLVLMLIMFGPLFLIAFIFYWKTIVKNKLLIICAGVFGFYHYFLIESFAMAWEAWYYNNGEDHSIGIELVGGSVIETLIWAVLLLVFLAIVLSVVLPKEEKGMSILIPTGLQKRFIKNPKIIKFTNKYL